MTPIQKLHSLRQSIWYDNIQRSILDNGELKALIDVGDIRGVTSNPTIFQNAIAKTSDYDSAILPLAWAGWDAEKIFWRLAIDDIQRACDLFAPLYEESKYGDGYVSLEVSPSLSNDADGMIAQAKELWERVSRPNLMIKIPATKAGVVATRQVIAAGINVNVTLIFSLDRYQEVMNAYLSGIEDRVAHHLPVRHVVSVASFFISRVDTKIDSRLPADSDLRGKIAIANAKLAYHAFEEFFTSARFATLKARFRARVQRPLWASTGTKNPAYPDTLYVDSLVGHDTVNTVPPATLNAFRDHGVVKLVIVRGFEESQAQLATLEAAGISMSKITQELEDEGVKSFADSFNALMDSVEAKRKRAASFLNGLADSVARRLSTLEVDSVAARLWSRDATLWTTDAAEQAEIKIRLGWLDSIRDACVRMEGYLSFAKEIHDEGIERVLVIGMGGSSLTAETFALLLAAANIETKMKLAILDSTDPSQVAQTIENYPPDKTLYILASKSGGTAELLAAFDYLWKLSKGDGSRFIAITDAGTSLEALAKERNFRKIFNPDSNVGGRFAALTDFGLVPAALLGMDIDKLISVAERMESASALQNDSVGFALGAALAEATLAGRDKLTVIADAPVSALAHWIEQVIAESSGKHGKGILPVVLEPLASPEVYGADRFFVYLRGTAPYGQTGELDSGVAKLRDAGYPVVEFAINNPYDAGAEFFKWELAISVACHILGINTFDQPDVQDSKLRTIAKIKDFQATGKLADADLVEAKAAQSALDKLLSHAQAGTYIAILAYVPRNDETTTALQALRVKLRDKTKCATTFGFGPRFQHSTGQFHKGGPNTGLFIQIVCDADADMEIPTPAGAQHVAPLTFGALIRAQALGDYEALVAAGRKVIRIHLGNVGELKGLG